MPYIDAFMAAVPIANRDAYVAHSNVMIPLFKEYGALSGHEAWGDDIPEGKVTDMRMAVRAGADEAVVFGWAIWPDKATRDSAWQKMMEDPRMADADPMPFDGKRMILGGFESLLEY